MMTSRKEPYNFSWFVVNKVAACSYPRSTSEIEWLTSQGIKHVLCLDQRFDIHTVMISEGHGIMNKTTRESALGIKLKIVEIEEFGGFSQTNVKDLVEYLKEIRNLSEPLVVHCRMGNGRTGMVLALYAMLFEDLDPWQAIKRVRSVRPRSIETRAQEESLVQVYDFVQSSLEKKSN